MKKQPIGGAEPMFSSRALIRLIIPLIIEQLLAVTIGMADTVMVSSVGEAAVSGVSLVDSINLLLLQVFAALGAGGAIVCAQYLGREDAPSACEAAKQLIWVVTGLSVAIAAVCLVSNEPLLRMIYRQLEPAVMENASRYFFLTALSYPFIAAYSAGTAVFRAQGNSRISMLASLMMNLINIAGNAYFIYGLKLGAAGAGLATLLSRIAGAALILFLLRNRLNTIHIAGMFPPIFRRAMIGRILRVGIPNGLENGMFHFGKIVMAGLVASFGTAAITANAIANSIGSVSTVPGTAIGLAMVTVVGQCVGAGDDRQAKRYTLRLMGASYALMIVLCAVLWFAAPGLIALFRVSEEATAIALDIMRLFAFLCATLWPMSFALPNGLRAAGDARFTMAASIGSMWAFRVGCSYLFANTFGMGVQGVWIAMYVDWAFRATAFGLRFLSGKWKNRAVV